MPVPLAREMLPLTAPERSIDPEDREAAPMTVVKTLCNRDCPDACGIVATVENGRVTKLAGDPDHPVTKGFLCYRTNQFLSTQYSPERLTTPLIRRGEHLEPATWEEALARVAADLQRIKAESGPAAILHYRSGGSLGILLKLVDAFFERFGPVTVKRGDICSGAGEAAQLLDFGACDSNDLFDLLEARHVILWGKNVFTSSPHTLTVLKEAERRGTRMVLVDPVHHRTAEIAERFVQPRPGGDFALAMAVLQVVFARGLTHPDASRYCDGLDALERLCHSKSIDALCMEADVTLAEVEDLAARFADGPTTILVGWGMARRKNGGAIVRALDALGAITGNIGIKGAGVSYYFRRRGAFDTSSLSSGEAARTFPEPMLGPAILQFADPPIRAVWITAGNPVAMLPETETTAKALASRELVVVVDSFLTDTARLAHVVLPTTTLLESDDLLGAFGHHYLGVTRPVVTPPAGVKSDLEIVQALAEHVGLGEHFAGSPREWKERAVERRLVPAGVSLSDLEGGAVKNPLAQPVLFEGRIFPTPSGRVNLVTTSPPTAARPTAEFPLLLTSLSTPKSQSSQWAKPPELPLSLVVHPEVATGAGLSEGEIGVLESAIGAMRVRVRCDPKQRRDVALLPKGGHRAGGASANALVRAVLTDLGEGGALYDEAVRLRREGEVT